MQDRRSFLRGLMGLTAGLTLGPTSLRGQTRDHDLTLTTVATPPHDRLGQLLPTRRLGRTDEQVTILGFGGSHMMHEGQSEKQVQALIETALEQGIRFIDTAQQYGNGQSESLMGQYLTPKYRDVIYLMTKTQAREAEHARRDMDGCRKRLKVDVIDLMQIHHLESVEEVDKAVDNGVVDVLLEAREAGKVRHLGFTGHDSPEAHLHMLDRLDQMGVKFDTVQMPVNVADPGYKSFTLGVLPRLIEEDYGVLAMKTLAFGHLIGKFGAWRRRGQTITTNLVPERMSLAEALGFVWSLPVSTLVSGMPVPEQIIENAELARNHVELDEPQREKLIDLAAEFAGPNLEFYKEA